MPERLDVEALRTSCIRKVNQYLNTLEGAEKLQGLPKPFNQRFTHAWSLPVEFSDMRRDLLVMLDAEFPFSLPRIAISRGPNLLEWPHLERDGLLCVVPNLTSFNYLDAPSVVRNVLSDACKLIIHNVSDDIDQELREEFSSYWSYACTTNAPSCISIVSPIGPTRQVSVWKGKSNWYFSDDPTTLRNWLGNLYPGTAKQSLTINKGWLIWRSQPWVPKQYPSNPADLVLVLKSVGSDLSLADLSAAAAGGLAVLVAAPTTSGVCFAALAHRSPSRRKLGPKGRGADPKIKGFRPGHVPPKVQFSRAFGDGSRMERCCVQRADAAWVHGRDQDPDSLALLNKRVTVIGIGSLGSEVAALLGKSGVGNLHLIDADRLEWANISRHRLGAESVGFPKARELAATLRKQLPHTSIEACERILRIQNTDDIGAAFSADLIVSVTGSWSAASLLNALWLDRDRPQAMIVAWLEAHASAAHSILLTKYHSSGCLQCHMTPTGRPELPVTEWREDPTLRVPACGGAFIPYGAAGISLAAALATQQCIDVLCGRSSDDNHRVWVGRYADLQRAGGTWSPNWVSTMGEPGTGGFQVTRAWSDDPTCVACGPASS